MPPQPPRDALGSPALKVVAPAAWGIVVTPVVEPARPHQTKRNRELDVYTAMAIVASVVFTVYQFCNVGNGLYPGTPIHTLLASLDAAVPFFFVLIGYRVFRPTVVAYLDRAPITPTRAFVLRQAIAVVPAYYTVITVVWFYRQQSLPGDWRDLFEHLTFTQVFDPKRIFYTDGPAWAASVGVFFLILVAVINSGLARFTPASTRAQRLIVLSLPIAALGAISLAWKAWSLVGAHRSTAGSSTTWYGPLANLDSFALGMVAALILAALESAPTGAKVRSLLRVFAVVVLLVAVITRQDGAWPTAYFTTICSVAFAAVVAAATLGAEAAPRRYEPPLSGVGRLVAIAYGTYLWREPVLLTLHGWGGSVVKRPDAFVQDTAVVLGVSILMGWLSYLAIEQPALQLYRLASRARRHPAPQ